MGHPPDCLPKDKFDLKAIEQLRKLPKEKLIPLVHGLLTWVEDVNWPVAQGAIDLVLTVPEHAVEAIRKILQTDDNGWAYNCLVYIVPHLPRQQRQRLRPELERFTHEPTQREIDEGSSESAQELLQSLGGSADISNG